MNQKRPSPEKRAIIAVIIGVLIFVAVWIGGVTLYVLVTGHPLVDAALPN